VRVRNSKLRRQLVTLAETALSRSRARPCLP
jgi:hypothetical protein